MVYVCFVFLHRLPQRDLGFVFSVNFSLVLKTSPAVGGGTEWRVLVLVSVWMFTAVVTGGGGGMALMLMVMVVLVLV